MKIALVKDSLRYFINRHPKFKNKTMIFLNAFPRLKEKLRKANQNKSSTEKSTPYVTKLTQLSPQANSLYADLQKAIALEKENN